MPLAQSAEVLYQLKQELDSFMEVATKGHLEMDQQDADVIRQAIAVRSCPEETYVIVVAIHKDPRKNSLTNIKCHRGTPLGGYTYDTVNESYCVGCVDHLALGLVNISFQLVLNDWTFYVPMPEGLLTKYLSEKQKANLASYRASFPEKDITFKFIQLLH